MKKRNIKVDELYFVSCFEYVDSYEIEGEPKLILENSIINVEISEQLQDRFGDKYGFNKVRFDNINKVSLDALHYGCILLLNNKSKMMFIKFGNINKDVNGYYFEYSISTPDIEIIIDLKKDYNLIEELNSISLKVSENLKSKIR